MTTSASAGTQHGWDRDRDVTDSIASLGQLWLVPVLVGTAGIVLGLLVVVWPDVTIKVAAVIFGIHLLIYGGFRVIQSLAADEAAGGQRVLLALIGVLALVAGVLVLRNLLQAVEVIAVLLGLFWLVGGILQIVVGFGSKTEHRAIEIIMGVLSAAAGLIVLLYPEISLVTLAVILGLWLMIFGVFGVVTGVRARHAFATP